GFVPVHGDYGAFDLSADRANAVRQILEREGLPAGHIFAVAGKADTQPLFPDDPSLAANRRGTITFMREDPPLPPDPKPWAEEYHNPDNLGEVPGDCGVRAVAGEKSTLLS